MKTPEKIYMVGIGGIGMSALAQLYKSQGAEVCGSDRDESPTTHMLREKGIEVYIGHFAAQVPEDAQLLVYSDAVTEDNPERTQAAKLGIEQKSYFEALGDVSKGKRTVAISGTNGKTTTTAMLGRMLIEAGLDPTVVVGSIVTEWNSNFRAPSNSSGQEGGGLFIVEACEYRNHFFVFNPEILVITNIELDHTDFFKSFDEVKAAFDEARTHARTVIDAAGYSGILVPELLLPGEFNKENARAAKAAAKQLAPHIADEVWDRSLASFKGTWRRFEYKGVLPKGALLYDDYAHHPTAIEKTIAAAREKFAGKKIVVAFHPHLYSRTRDLFDDFARALASADSAYILPVYAAREEFDASVSNEALAEAINKKGGHATPLSDFVALQKKLTELDENSVVFTMGAGDIYKAGEQALKK